jgi:hypothetical protein
MAGQAVRRHALDRNARRAHFPSLEQPGLFVTDLRAFFRQLR